MVFMVLCNQGDVNEREIMFREWRRRMKPETLLAKVETLPVKHETGSFASIVLCAAAKNKSPDEGALQYRNDCRNDYEKHRSAGRTQPGLCRRGQYGCCYHRWIT